MNRFLTAILFLWICSSIFGQKLPENGPLTLDAQLQALGKQMLKEKQGSIVAIDPQTGEIKCMVSSSFEGDDVNRAISAEYSPGSTFKTAQALTLVSEHILNKDSKFSCQEGFWASGVHIGCHKHRSPQSLIGAIAESCNSYFCRAFMAMIDNCTRYKNHKEAINIWNKYMSSMGLGHPLGVDIPGEKGGVIPDSRYLDKIHTYWNAQTIMWVGMGQGEVRVTPLQLCNLAASIANRGFFYTPHIHQFTTERPLPGKFTEKHTTLATAEAYKDVIQGMRMALVYGTAKSENSEDFAICGKTGTAENEGDDHSIFIGFAPMDNPKIAVSVFVENGGFGADMAAPLAALIMEQYIMGELSKESQHEVKQWEDFIILPPE